ncbi:unnamed protein product [Didymodactylos carnosus]|uniref:Uncharacterized protein n=1 Tax=Didymodactylos carnosus TaxID=1234261 RepID=A0A8S2DAT1_9BILA|nr:unnamed protein product [Didymodactylos carnosus]CAF3700424.1 unnamed protein product [Didymodactylos carnosus]
MAFTASFDTSKVIAAACCQQQPPIISCKSHEGELPNQQETTTTNGQFPFLSMTTDAIQVKTSLLLESDGNLPQCLPYEKKKTIEEKRYDDSVVGRLLLIPSDYRKIFEYIERGNFEALKKTIEHHHAEVIKMRNRFEQTILHVAVRLNLAYIWIRLFLMRGVDPTAKDEDGLTAAHYVCEKDDVEMLKALLLPFHAKVKSFQDNVANDMHNRCVEALSITDNCGLTPFMLSCSRKAVKCVEYLHEHHPAKDIDLTNGETCLHYAVALNDLKFVQYLVQICGVRVNAGSEHRPSPLDIAMYRGHNDIVEFLIKNNGQTRFSIQRVVSKRKNSCDLDLNIEALTLHSSEDTAILQPKSSRTQDYILPMESDNHPTAKRQKTSDEFNKEVAHLFLQASLCSAKEDLDGALNYYNDVLSLLLGSSDEGPHPELAKAYNSIGLIYHRKGDFATALVNYLKELEIVSKSNNHSVTASCYGNIGLIYAIQHNSRDAVENFEKALLISRSNPQKNQTEIKRLEKYIGDISKRQ